MATININKFNKLFSKFKLTYDEVQLILNYSGSIKSFISGSMALSVFLDEKFDDEQDLDIYIMEYNKNIIKKHLEYIDKILDEKGYESSVSKDYIDYNKFGKYKYHNQYIKEVITYFYYSDKDTIKIQIIIIDDCIIKNLLDTFDINIVKLAIYSTGNEMYFYEDTTNDYLKNQNLALIKYKKMYVTDLNSIQKSIIRIFKYLNRGFQLCHHQTYEDIIFIDKYLRQELGYNGDLLYNNCCFNKNDLFDKNRKTNKTTIILSDSESDSETYDSESDINNSDLRYEKEIEFIKNYINHPQNALKTDIYNKLKNYSFSEKDIKYNRIYYIDRFNLYTNEEQNISKKVNKLFDIDYIESCMIEINYHFIRHYCDYIKCPQDDYLRLSFDLFNLINEIKKI